MLGRDDISTVDRLAFEGLWLADHRYGEKLVARPNLRRAVDAARRRVRRRVGRRLEARGRGRILPVDERLDLSPQKFMAHYLRPARPVVLRGAASHWECLGDGVAARLAHVDRDFLAGLVGHPIRLGDEPGSGVPLQVELASHKQGTTTRLHSRVTNDLVVQLGGEQRWIIIPPSYDAVVNPGTKGVPGGFGSDLDPFAPDPSEFGMFRYVDRWEVTLDPGDVLYNPPFHWHATTCSTGSTRLRFSWFWRVSAQAASRAQHRLSSMTPMATSPLPEAALH